MDEIKDQGFSILTVRRMRKNKDTPYSMVLVTAEKSDEGKKIFNIRQIFGLSVRTESKRRQTGKTQCYRWQRFGHVQSNCTIPPRCAFCAEEHHTNTCSQPRGAGLRALCVNCGGGHPSFANSCPRNPLNKKEHQQRGRPELLRPNVSYASATQPQNSQIAAEDLDQRIARVLKQLLPDVLRAVYGK